MNRRNFNGLALGAGLIGSLAPESSFAQWEVPPDAPQPINVTVKNTPRAYNYIPAPRKYVKGKRRFSIYWSWNYPWESNQDLTVLDNRFSSITEVRRVAWPGYERPEYSERMFLQGISGTLELFHLSMVRFQSLVGEATGQPVHLYQRVDQAGQSLPLDDRILADTDTLMLFSLDHMVTDQQASPEEIEAVRRFLTREGTCLMLGPHHDVGASSDLKERQIEYVHHGDPLVPRQQRFSTYARSLMKGLGIPVENRYGLNPALVEGTTNKLAPLTKFPDLDKRGWLNGVTTFNYHPHLPHYALTNDTTNSVHVLARQPVNMARPHPFTAAGNREFNMFLWMPPSGSRAGDILMADLTIFSTLFGADDSLHRFWHNLATK